MLDGRRCQAALHHATSRPSARQATKAKAARDDENHVHRGYENENPQKTCRTQTPEPNPQTHTSPEGVRGSCDHPRPPPPLHCTHRDDRTRSTHLRKTLCVRALFVVFVSLKPCRHTLLFFFSSFSLRSFRSVEIFPDAASVLLLSISLSISLTSHHITTLVSFLLVSVIVTVLNSIPHFY